MRSRWRRVAAVPAALLAAAGPAVADGERPGHQLGARARHQRPLPDRRRHLRPRRDRRGLARRRPHRPGRPVHGTARGRRPGPRQDGDRAPRARRVARSDQRREAIGPPPSPRRRRLVRRRHGYGGPPVRGRPRPPGRPGRGVSRPAPAAARPRGNARRGPHAAGRDRQLPHEPEQRPVPVPATPGWPPPSAAGRRRRAQELRGLPGPGPHGPRGALAPESCLHGPRPLSPGRSRGAAPLARPLQVGDRNAAFPRRLGAGGNRPHGRRGRHDRGRLRRRRSPRRGLLERGSLLSATALP